MARRRLVLEGAALEAVERLAESSGVSPAELIKRALRREDDAQRGSEALAERVIKDSDAPSPLNMNAVYSKFWTQVNSLGGEVLNPPPQSGNQPDSDVSVPGPIDDPVPYVPQTRSSETHLEAPGQLYMIYLDRRGVVYLKGLANSANFQKYPAPSAVDFDGLLQYLANRPGDLIDMFINADGLRAQIPDPWGVEEIAAVHSRAEFFTIATTIDQYFKIAGFENTWEITTSSTGDAGAPSDDVKDEERAADSL